MRKHLRRFTLGLFAVLVGCLLTLIPAEIYTMVVILLIVVIGIYVMGYLIDEEGNDE